MFARNVEIDTRPVPSCALCGTVGEVQHSDLRDKLYSAPGVWSIRRCPNCRLGWADPQPEIADMGKLYVDYYTHCDDAPNAQISAWHKRLLKRVAAAVIPSRKHAFLSDCRYLGDRKPGRLLDIGCGSGAFLAGMAGLGWQCTGVEFDEEAANLARKRGINVRLGSLEEQHFVPALFDAITLSNVIEHLPDPAATFTELRRILAPGGRIVMVTPNVNSLGHKAFGRCWRGLEPPRHLYLFNPRTLRAFAENAGLSVEFCFTTVGSSTLEASAGLWGDRADKPDIRLLKLKERLFGNGEFVVLLASYGP